MSKPIIAIVGRPNVGKSMLFNKIIGRRLSIVEDTPGVTRDRIYGESDWQGRKFTLIDTGGIEPRTDNQILAFMRSQAQIAIDNATVIVFLCDIKTGMTASDQEVASMLQRCGKPVILAVNKVDQGRSPDIYEFYNLGLGDPIAVSAVHGHGTGDLLDACVQYFPPEDEEEEDSDVLRISNNPEDERRQDSCEHSSSAAGVFAGFVLLSDCSWDKEKLIRDLREEWNLNAEEEGTQQEDILYFDSDGMTAAVTLIAAPVPEREAEINAAANYMWPEAVKTAEAHKAQLMVAV